MYCKRCGKEVHEDWKICPGCGTVLKDEATENNANFEVEKKPAKKQKKKKPFFKRIWFWIIIIIVGFVIFGGSGSNEESETEQSDSPSEDSASEFTPSTKEQIFSTGQKSAIDKLDDAVSEWTDGAFGSSGSNDELTVTGGDGKKYEIETDADGNPIIDENGNYIVKGSRFICQLGNYVCVDEDYPSAVISLYSEDGKNIKYSLFDANLSPNGLKTGDATIVDRNILRIDIADYKIEMIWSDETTMCVISSGKLGGTYSDIITDMTSDRNYILGNDSES